MVIYRGKMGQVERALMEANQKINRKVIDCKLSINKRQGISARTDIKHRKVQGVKAYVLKVIPKPYNINRWKRQHWKLYRKHTM